MIAETPASRRARVLREFERVSASAHIFTPTALDSLAADLDGIAAESPLHASAYRGRAEECRRHAASARARIRS